MCWPFRFTPTFPPCLIFKGLVLGYESATQRDTGMIDSSWQGPAKSNHTYALHEKKKLKTSHKWPEYPRAKFLRNGRV